MNPVLLSTLAAILSATPPTIDHWLAQKIKGAAYMALATSLVGLVVGAAGGLLTQLAQGSTFGDAETLVGVGLISGVGTALVNFLKASMSSTASGGGSVSGSITGSGIPAAKPFVVGGVGGAPASPRVVDVKWTPARHMGLRAALPAFAFVCLVPLAVLAVIGAVTEACTTQQAQTVAPVVAPVANLGACVAEGALDGLTLEQIVAKCGGSLEQVIAALFASTDDKVKASAAYGESVRILSMPIGGDAGTFGARK